MEHDARFVIQHVYVFADQSKLAWLRQREDNLPLVQFCLERSVIGSPKKRQLQHTLSNGYTPLTDAGAGVLFCLAGSVLDSPNKRQFLHRVIRFVAWLLPFDGHQKEVGYVGKTLNANLTVEH
ncbi:hypothetical protein BaRGS_00028643 [Batillaria attramentaria]|uniref:Uncharacterized protein n=1 Tax=Batillaria attramentaria TaxID=370345 RepID=A0ABD0JZ37_9CAEN